MSTKLIVVVGATGNQGGSVVESFSTLPGWKVRAITRDPNKSSSQAIASKGVEVVAGDLDDITSLEAAFAGATAIFGVTDFWQFPRDPKAHSIAAEKNVPLNKVCYDLELQQAKNIIDAAAKVGKSLERFVFSTLSDTTKWSNGRLTHNLHFDGKAAASKYLDSTYPDLASKTSSIQVGMYMTNWRMSSMMGPRRKAGNSKNFVIRKPTVDNAKKMPWVHPPQDTGPCVKALVLKCPPGVTMLVYSTQSTTAEYASLWTKVMRERGLIEPDAVCEVDHTMTYEEAEQTMPAPFGKEIRDSMEYASTYGFTGGDPDVKSPEECGVNLAELSKLEAYIRNEDWSEILKEQQRL